MKAIVYDEYGSPDVLRLEEVDTPTPADDEILIKVHAVSLNRSDWEGLIRKPLYARFGGLRKPGNPILGSDIAGRVERAGKNNSQFQPGETVLINGAGGGAGSFAVQLAKLYGAEVTGVDNAEKLDFMYSLGADHVIDYTREDFTKNGKQYDFILDLIAYRSAFAYARALKPNGSYYAVGGSVTTFLQFFVFGPWIKRNSAKNVRLLAVQRNRKDLIAVTELCE